MSPQFHETGYGQAFFTHQLPTLIKSIKEVGVELKRHNDLTEQNMMKNKEDGRGIAK